MGFPMAGHLVSKNSNLDVKVYNRRIEKSEKWVSKFNGSIRTTPADAAKKEGGPAMPDMGGMGGMGM